MAALIQIATEKLQRREHLTRVEARAVMEELLSGSVPDEEIVALLAALRDKGETTAELVGFAQVMREHAAELLARAGLRVETLSAGAPLLDTCGTGGDGQGTFNISTATAIVASAAGVRVAKHGNRSISSRCGSADVLGALGVSIELAPERIGECLETVGMVFLFAPHLHQATRHVMNARRLLKTKTVFNLLGPLTNPLGASAQLAGVYHRERTALLAEALTQVGTPRALVVAGWDGLDEVSISAPTRVSESRGQTVETRDITPEDFGVPRARTRSLTGGNAATNARLLTLVLEGEGGPHRDAVLVNTSAALVVSGRARTLVEGMAVAAEAVDSGAARRTLVRLAEFTRRHRI